MTTEQVPIGIIQVRQAAASIRSRLVKADDGCCFVCGFSIRSILRLHHIIPVSKGGTNHPHNLKLLCPTCHDLVHEAGRRRFCPTTFTDSQREEHGRKFWEFKRMLESEYDEDASCLIFHMGGMVGQA